MGKDELRVLRAENLKQWFQIKLYHQKKRVISLN